MELRQLRYFIAAARTENFTAAARELNVVQPALCRQINQLESELGYLLFERLKRGVKLTPAGKMLAPELENLLDSLNKSISNAELIAKGKKGIIKIGFSDSAAYDPAFTLAITSFRSHHPDINLNLLADDSFKVFSKLMSGELDIGFIYWPVEDLIGFQSIEICSSRILLAINENHRFKNRSSVRLSELENEQFVWLSRESNPYYYDAVLSSCLIKGFRIKISEEVPSDNMMLSMVSAGAGITFISEMANNWKPKNVKIIEIDDFYMTISLHAVYPNPFNNPCLRELLNALGSP